MALFSAGSDIIFGEQLEVAVGLTCLLLLFVAHCCWPLLLVMLVVDVVVVVVVAVVVVVVVGGGGNMSKGEGSSNTEDIGDNVGDGMKHIEPVFN